MTDEDNDGGASGWENIPRSARMIVYSILREQAATFEKTAAMTKLITDIVGPQSKPGSVVEKTPSGATAVKAAHALAADACWLALAELQDLDPEWCDHCGEYHDGPEPETHPKDLS